MISFIIRTDVHIAEKGPASRKDDYLAACLDKLSQVGNWASIYKAAAVIDNGDFFHFKSPLKNSHKLIQKVAEVHAPYPCPVYANPGNHDLPYGNAQHLDSQPLGTLYATGVFKRMDDVTFTDGDIKVRLVGLPYKPDFTPEDFNIQKGDEDYLIVAAHTYASLEGGEQFGREVALSYRDLSFMPPDVFIFGHWHEDQGITELKGKHFFNLGSLTRGSLSHDNISKKPRIGLLTFTPDDIFTEALSIKVAPASEVFDLVAHASLKKEELRMQNYLDSMKSFLGRNSSSNVDTYNLVKNLDPVIWGEEIRQKALEIMEEAIDLKKS